MNCYEDEERAQSYAGLEFPGTYYLAFRDLPEIIRSHVQGTSALDFGCGAGRSTRFLRALGLTVTSVDISEEMLRKARAKDAGGDYRLVGEGGLRELSLGSFDLILAAFPFDNIPASDKSRILPDLRALLTPVGRIVNLVSAPEIYLHEWTSFSTKDFPENKDAKSGEIVRIIMTDVADQRPVQDFLCTEESYEEIYRTAGLEIEKAYRPLGKSEEPYNWVNETRIAPWIIQVLRARL